MTLNRLSLPEEFYDITSAQLLAQPEPQYFYAQMFKAALGAELASISSMGVPGREVSGNGAQYSPADRDRLVLASPLPGQLFAVKVDFKGQPGHTMRFNRPRFTNSTYTQASRAVLQNQTISTTPIGVSGEQTFITLGRFAGPYDNDNTRVAPYAIDRFDAQMGVHKLGSMVGTHLKRDHDKFLDSVWVTLADASAGTTVYPEGMTADNDAASKGSFPLTYEQMSRTAKKMDEAHLPTMPDGKRLFVCTSTGKKQLKDDPQYARYSEFHKEINPLFPGYFGSTPEFHLFVSNTLTTTNNSSSVAIHKAHAIAPMALMGGMGAAPSVRYASDDNYGETPKVIWLADYAFGVADTRFIYSVRYAEDVA